MAIAFISFWAILDHIFSALLIGGFLYAWQLARYRRALRRFNGAFFDVFYKENSANKVRTVILTVRGHTIKYSGENIHKGSAEGTFNGEIIMNPINLRLGSGVHYHDDYDGFNFPVAFIKDADTICLQTNYLTSKDQKPEYWKFDIKYQAYIFRRNTEFKK